MHLSAEGIGLWQCQELQRVVVVWLREDRRKFKAEEFKAK